MRNRKKILMTLVLLLAIGFATVSSTLLLNGVIGISSNQDDFNIIFTNAKLNSVKQNDFIDQETKQTINFETDKLTKVDEEAILDYEVTNTSRLYDGEVEINCIVPDNEYVVVDYQPRSMIVEDSSYLLSEFINLLEIENLNYLDTSKVTDMSNMFAGCSTLTSLDISNFDISKVAMIQDMLLNISSNTIVKVKDIDMQNWVLTSDNGRPSSWSTENVLIAT